MVGLRRILSNHRARLNKASVPFLSSLGSILMSPFVLLCIICISIFGLIMLCIILLEFDWF